MRAPFLSFSLLLSLVIAASGADAPWQPAPGPLATRWAKDVDPAKCLPEYPRPQLVRSDWQNLNGLWDYAVTDKSAPAPAAYDGRLLVPFPYESQLSGVGKPSIPNQRLWMRRTIEIPDSWKGQRVLLHFGAVNWESSIFLNGAPIGDHKGGYDAFTFDITSHLKPGANELVVGCLNPVRSDVPDAQVLGKQRLHPGGIFYTAATGIWQTVWLEPVPEAHLEGLILTPDVDGSALKLTAQREGAPAKIVATIESPTKGQPPISTTDVSGEELRVAVPNPELWSPDHPALYNLTVQLYDGDKVVDTVKSYFAMRKISLGKDDAGHTRIFLNNKFLFQMGVLDQGYWPDGIYTAPTDDALRYDLEAIKQLGFNLSRKHAKVEPDRWYYWADKLGVLVWQDMPQMFGKNNNLSDDANKQFEVEWRREIAGLYNHPSIIVWTTFNEGWGQHDTEQVVDLTKKLDPSRLVNNASGWTDKNCGDIHDTHAYPAPWCEEPTATRAAVCGEFGGLGMRVDGHMWSKDGWGYQGVYKKAFSLTRRYQQLLQTVHKLIDERGLSAAVYTQITDVELESNGLLTYDRAVIKPDLAITSGANLGRFLPLPADPNPDLVPTAQDEPLAWRFTTEQPPADWFAPSFDDSAWKSAPAPFGHSISGVRTQWRTGDIWIRREVNVPEKIPAKPNFSVLHDEDAEIYVNGVLGASVTGFVGAYVDVPMNDEARQALKPGKNILAVHCHNTIGGQGIDIGIGGDTSPVK